jgi:hypothetical protein
VSAAVDRRLRILSSDQQAPAVRRKGLARHPTGTIRQQPFDARGDVVGLADALYQCLRSNGLLEPCTIAKAARPASETWGFDRGRPIDRHYIDQFFASFASDMRGGYWRLGSQSIPAGTHGTLRSHHVLDINPGNKKATLIADLTAADSRETDRFDCFVLPQTLQFIFDLRAALSHAHRILRPGGVLLATVSAISRIDPGLYACDYWRFTPASCERLAQQQFGPNDLTIACFGNALSCAAFIKG